MQMMDLKGRHLRTRAPLTKSLLSTVKVLVQQKDRSCRTLPETESSLREVEAFMKSPSHQISLSMKRLSLEVKEDPVT